MQTRGLFSLGIWLLFRVRKAHTVFPSPGQWELTLCTSPWPQARDATEGRWRPADSISPRAPQSIWVPDEVLVQKLGFVFLRGLFVPPPRLTDGETVQMGDPEK